jgi:hypothetical protein
VLTQTSSGLWGDSNVVGVAICELGEFGSTFFWCASIQFEAIDCSWLLFQSRKIHGLLYAGLPGAIQVELLFMVGGLHRVTKATWTLRVSGNLFLHKPSAVIVAETRHFMENDPGPPEEGAASFHTTGWTTVVKATQSQAQVGQSALAKLCRVYWCPFYIFAKRRGHSADGVKDLTPGFFLHLLDYRALTGVDRLKGKFHPFLTASFRSHPSGQVDQTRGLGSERYDLRKRYTALLREEFGRMGSDPAEIDEQIHALCEALIASEGKLGP